MSAYATVVAALRSGDCLGFAPEGVSRFLPYMESPLKLGAARIALEAVRKAAAAGDASFTVRLAPVCLTFTHREKFRSNACMRYCEPIAVDASVIARHTQPNGEFDESGAAHELTDALNAAMVSSTINASDWETAKLAITAARLHLALSTDLSLELYLSLLRAWAALLDVVSDGQRLACTSKYTEGTSTERALAPRPPAPAQQTEKVGTARDALRGYQARLDSLGITCEHVRHAARDGPKPAARVLGALLCAASLALAYLGVSLPGLLVWSPVWAYLKRCERSLLAKGPRWADSVAEMKMMVGGLVLPAAALGCAALALALSSVYPVLCVAGLYATMVCYEAGLTHARSAITHAHLLLLPRGTMPELVAQRALAKAALDATMGWFDPAVLERLATPHNEAALRRPPRDWNTVLRLHDHVTMDYVQ